MKNSNSPKSKPVADFDWRGIIKTKEFYFLGEIIAQGKPEFAPKYNGFKILYKLDTPVRADIFDYLTTVTV